MKTIFSVVIFIAHFSFQVYADNVQYTCPMHPHYISNRDGACPICGMDLVKMPQNESSDEMSSSSVAESEILYWRAPMDPSYRSDKPGKSPMGMDLVPVYAEKKNNIAGLVTIEPGIVQNMGVITEPVEFAKFGTEIRSYGEVSEDERKQYAVSSRVSGWIEKLAVTAIGDLVEEGALLYELYSPELVSAQQDYLSALRIGDKGRIASTKKRLMSLGVQSKAIAQIKDQQEYLNHVPFYSEVSGVVSALNIKTGSYIKSGMHLATVQDYSSVWINVSVAEKDLQFLSSGMAAEVRFSNLSNEVKIAHVDYIYPTVNESSRTGLVRLVLNNSRMVLRPGAYADVAFDASPIRMLSVPAEAVLRSSEGSYVIIALGKGKFQPRKIEIGTANKGRIHVISGLDEGDMVVVSGQFMIDSESSLRGSFRKMKMMEMSLSEIKISDSDLAMIDHIIDGTLYIHESIIDGFDISNKMLSSASEAAEMLQTKFKDSKLGFILLDARDAIKDAQESITERQLLKSLDNLTKALKPWILEGRPKYYREKGVKVFYDHTSESNWLQMDIDPLNPFGDGHAMLEEWVDLLLENNKGEASAD